MYLRSSYAARGNKMSFRMRQGIADGEQPHANFDLNEKRQAWLEDTVCILFCLLAHVNSGRW